MSILHTILYGKGWSVRDATGRRVMLFDHLKSAVWPDDQETLTRTELQTLQQSPPIAKERRSLRWMWMFIVLYLLIVIAFHTYNGVLQFRGKWSVTIVGILCLGFLIVWWWLCARVDVGTSPTQFASAMLKIGRCPSCGYRLTPSFSEKTTPCSECGSRWVAGGKPTEAA